MVAYGQLPVEVLASPITITGVTAATAALPGPQTTPSPGQTWHFSAWGTITTTADTQTIAVEPVLGGAGGTAVVTAGPLNPDDSAPVTASPLRITGDLQFASDTEASAAVEVYMAYFLSAAIDGAPVTVSGAPGQQLVLAITPSADAVEIVINGGYWQRIA